MRDRDRRAFDWARRHGGKQQLRERVWTRLERDGVSIGPVRSRIPNFRGAEAAAQLLATLPAWREAKVVKCNPDAAQAAVRRQALLDGKLLYTPVPGLTEGLPFYRLDPVALRERGVSFEFAATAEGAASHGVAVDFDAMQPLDLCVIGCVAVTRQGGRTGKGAGFADLELGFFADFGKLGRDTPIVTTVHSCQIVESDSIVMMAHDHPLDWICTESEIIETRTRYARPHGVDWDAVQPDQFADIPFLARLRDRARAAGGSRGSGTQ